jgi:tRNA (guanine-N7-)-methyltransferase
MLDLAPLTVLLNYQTLRDFKGWESLFGNFQPLKVEIGCGKDDSLIERALLEPQTNFIGIENDSGIAFRFERKVRRSGALNLKIVLFEAHFVLSHLLNQESVETFFLQFPDPWPKRRHAKRRVLNFDFVKKLWERLVPEGEFFIATDVPDIAQLALEMVNQVGGFINCAGKEIFEPKKAYPVLTLYEKKFLSQGLPIYYLRFKKL